MREKGFVGVAVLIVLLLIGLVAVGYFSFFNKRAQIDRAIKPDTSREESVKDRVIQRSEIVESGYNLKITIKPSDNNIISGVVTITANDALEETAGVGFFISENEDGYKKGGLPNIEMDDTPADGWRATLDTTEYSNANYYIHVIAYPPGGEGNPLGVATIPVEIKN